MLALERFVFLAGVGQLALVVASLLIPRVLRWSDEVAKLRPLTRQVFWTYAAYIWSINLFFGLVSVMIPAELISGQPLSQALTLFIAIYWTGRVGIQFFYFDRSDAPKGWHIVVAECLLVGLFLALVAVYGLAVLVNFGVTA